MTEDDLHEQPGIIRRLFGPDYNGPLSTFAEWHALEYGATTGFALAVMYLVPLSAPIVLLLFGAGYKRGLVTREMLRQIWHEKHYYGLGAIGLFFATVTGVPWVVG